MIGLGVDPGFAFVGFALVDFLSTSTRIVHQETFRTSSKETDEQRLDLIADRLADLVERFNPAFIAYENQAIVEAAKHARRRKDPESELASNFSSCRVHETAGIIRCAARFYDLPCYVEAPSTVKVAVLGKGGGRAPKSRVKEAIQTIFRVDGLSEHAADAIACAVSGSRKHQRERVLLREHSELIH